MITKIGVKNFKLFKEEIDLELKPITILTGANNSGKSTFIKFVKFLFSIYQLVDDPNFHGGEGGIVIKDFENLVLNQHHIKYLGGINNILSKGTNDNSLTFSFTYLANQIDLYSKDTSGIKLTAKLKYTCDSFNTADKKTRSKVKTEHLHLNNIAFYYKNNMLFSLELTENKQEFEDKNVINPNEIIWKLSEFKNFNKLRDYVQAYWEEQRVSKNRKNWQDKFNIDKKILIPSYFFNTIICDTNFFNNELNPNSYEKGLRDYLIENGIKNREDFLKEYLEFESKFIRQILYLKFSNLFELNENDIFKTWQLSSLSLKKSFEKDSFKSKQENEFYEEIIKSTDSPLSSVVLTEIMSNKIESTRNTGSVFSHLNNKFIKPESKLEHQDIYIAIKLINWTITETFRCFTSDLPQLLAETIFASNIPFVGQEQRFKSIFHEDGTESEDSILYMFGNYYFQFETKRQLEFINNWLEKLKIAKELILEPIRNGDGDILSFTYKIKQYEYETNIEDLGLGSRKLLLILMQLAMNGNFKHNPKEKNVIYGFDNLILNGKMVILEEPESNLHPSFQSKLADIIVDAYVNLNVRVLVETHSEYLIRKLQYLVASMKEDIQNNNIAIYYMHNPDQVPEGENQLYKLDLRGDGFMNNDFGSGFFDEASSLSLRLLNFSNFN
jgi:AAA15 family ATPase/GTPase